MVSDALGRSGPWSKALAAATQPWPERTADLANLLERATAPAGPKEPNLWLLMPDSDAGPTAADTAVELCLRLFDNDRLFIIAAPAPGHGARTAAFWRNTAMRRLRAVAGAFRVAVPQDLSLIHI